MNAKQSLVLSALIENFGVGAVVNKADVIAVSKKFGVNYPGWFFVPENRTGRSMYRVPSYPGKTSYVDAVKNENENVVEASAGTNVVSIVKSMNVETTGFTENLIPEKDPLFVAFGNYSTLKNIIASKMFYPVYITGLSGNGKTMSVEQACAQLKREMIRVNFTLETDEDDLIGGFRLVNGETKFFKGPVVKAMERGAILLLDEIDLGSNKIMCLQSIIEGKGYFIKKTGEFIKPAPGFNIFTTANTKGKGSTDGRFIGTNVLNEAFLERFPITCEQEYPSTIVEKKIVLRVFESLNVNDEEFVSRLVDWADIIRQTFFDGGIDEIISTRRLVHIAKAYSIFKDRMVAIDMCINRFDEDTKRSFRDLYTKIDSSVSESADSSATAVTENDDPFKDDIPF
jgi:hypothetical protein